jgi:hypothetical protein
VTVPRQIPWRLNRRSALVAMLCLLAGVLITSLLFAVQRQPMKLTVLSTAIALSLGLALWLAWCAMTWHLAYGRETEGPYVFRYSGLFFGLPMWSAQTLQFYRQLDSARSALETLFWLLFGCIISAPFALWGGIVFRYFVVVILGKSFQSR